MLDHRLRPNIKPTLAQRNVFGGSVMDKTHSIRVGQQAVAMIPGSETQNKIILTIHLPGLCIALTR